MRKNRRKKLTRKALVWSVEPVGIREMQIVSELLRSLRAADRLVADKKAREARIGIIR
jgi:hypothetical protein